MHFLDLQVDFFLPVWRRVAVVVVCIGWAFFEFATGAITWGVIFGGTGLYALWQFFLNGWPANPSESIAPDNPIVSDRDES